MSLFFLTCLLFSTLRGDTFWENKALLCLMCRLYRELLELMSNETWNCKRGVSTNWTVCKPWKWCHQCEWKRHLGWKSSGFEAPGRWCEMKLALLFSWRSGFWKTAEASPNSFCDNNMEDTIWDPGAILLSFHWTWCQTEAQIGWEELSCFHDLEAWISIWLPLDVTAALWKWSQGDKDTPGIQTVKWLSDLFTYYKSKCTVAI